MTKQRITDVIESTQEEKNRALEERERLGYDAVRNFLYKYIIYDNSFLHDFLLIKYTSFINSLKFDRNGKPEMYVLSGILESNKNLALEILSLFLEYRTFYTININRIGIDSVINSGRDFDKKKDLENIKIYFAHKYDIIYTGENRGVFLKNNIEIVQAIQETENDELIDIIKSANRVGVKNLENEIRMLSNYLEENKKIGDETRMDRLIKFLVLKIENEEQIEHPMKTLIRNFTHLLNKVKNLRHKKNTTLPPLSIEAQRVLFDMGLSLARLEMELTRD